MQLRAFRGICREDSLICEHDNECVLFPPVVTVTSRNIFVLNHSYLKESSYFYFKLFNSTLLRFSSFLLFNLT